MIMFNERLNLMRRMLQMFESTKEIEIADLPAFKLRMALRDNLVHNGGFPVSRANEVAAAIDINVPMDILDDEEEAALMFKIVDSLSDFIIRTEKAVSKEFNSWALFLRLLDGANIHLTES